MKILYVCGINPSLTTTGGHQRTHLQVKLLQSFADVDILFFNSGKKEPEIENIQQLCLNDQSSGKFNKRIKQLLNLLPCSSFFIHPMDKNCKKYFEETVNNEKYDYIFFRYIFPYMKCGAPQLRNMIIDIDDLPWQNSMCIAQNKNNGIFKRIYHSYRAFWVKYFCKQLFPHFKTVYFSNRKDIIGNNASLLPNIPYIKSEDEPKSQESINSESNPIVLFVGSLSHVPNYEGLNHFIDSIWPQIIKEYPLATLRIVGRGLPETLYKKWTKVKNVELLGFVESLTGIYKTASLVISPIYAGAGTNIKVLEALAYGRICVLSTFSYRGYEADFKNHKDLIVCNDDSHFACSIINVLQDPSKYEAMRQSGKRKVQQFYSEKKLLNSLRSNLILS